MILVQALQRAKRLFDEALPKFDWGRSALDANAIQLLNEVPGEVEAALKEAGKVWEPTIDRVREFHEAFGHPVTATPDPMTKALRELRVKLIAEELTELCDALGVDLEVIRSAKDGEWRVKVEATADDEDVDLVEAADALGDLDYVVAGANLVFGFPAQDVSAEIHRANMSKLGADGKPIYREDGKVMKGPNYTPPNVAGVLSGSVGHVWLK
ncbi:nucleotide pyrophosphohydrolase [Bordetella phage FP1]|uniref:Nucleotide pyrophosphohydrolase n=1 Tax=Bordetella phage FP1 TaxID=1916125 RepID=A0A2D0WBN9_9CAUD|nr:nucleotide pyrophosphohydrolase [Bordetella phage FP1]APL99351.1 nucleotide pyrophosphohydrolase [Bordetella phage FP1]